MSDRQARGSKRAARIRAGVVSSLVAVLAAPAAAQDKKPSGQINVAPGTPNQVGDYSGVEPGSGAPGGRPRRGKYPLVTWIGFQPQEGGSSRVFIQLDRGVSHRQEVKNGALVIALDGARYANTNARRHLDTRFFETAVERITTQPLRRGRRSRGSGVEIAIRFKNPADARDAAPTVSTGKDGMTYLMVEIGQPGAAPDKAPADPE
jgi:hypothetical protein